VKEDKSFWHQKWKSGSLISEYKIQNEDDVPRIKQGFASKLFTEQQQDFLITDTKWLPYKVVLLIFSFLDAKSLCRSSLVCKSWKKMSKTNVLWKDLVKRRWALDERETIKNWKKSYQHRLRFFKEEKLPTSGCGTFTFRNGNRYEGDWENSTRHGYGRMLYFVNTNPLDSFIETYEGDWKNERNTEMDSIYGAMGIHTKEI